jgi:hypothetical protein
VTRPDPADIDHALAARKKGLGLTRAEAWRLADEVVALRAELAEAIEQRNEWAERVEVVRAAREAAERERDGYKQTANSNHWRAEAAETELRELRLVVARQLTPLDVAVTHIDILRRKSDDYTPRERDNVAIIVESHAEEARKALFDALRAEET